MQRHMPLSFIIYYTSIVCFKDCSVCNMFIDIEWEILFFLFDHFLYSNICSGSCTLNIKAVPTVWYFFLFNLLNMQFLASWILHEHHDIYFQFLQDILSVPVHLTCHHVYIQGACCKKWKLMSALLEFPIAHEWNKNTCRYIYIFFLYCFFVFINWLFPRLRSILKVIDVSIGDFLLNCFFQKCQKQHHFS